MGTKCFCPAGLQSGMKANELTPDFGSTLSKGQWPTPCHDAVCPSAAHSVPSGSRGCEQPHPSCPGCARQGSAAASRCASTQPGSALALGSAVLSRVLGRGSARLALRYHRDVPIALMSRAPPSPHLGPGPPAVEPARCLQP